MKFTTKDLCYIALCAAFIAVCSWISVPATVPFTLQTFGVFLSVGLLGGKRGMLATAVYILLGAVGLPVFAGFTGGIGIILGTLGGYIVGFFFAALVMWLMLARLGDRKWVLPCAMVAGMLVCYALGTVWFATVYASTKGPVAIASVLGWCVLPYIIPDVLKILLALITTNRLKKVIKL